MLKGLDLTPPSFLPKLRTFKAKLDINDFDISGTHKLNFGDIFGGEDSNDVLPVILSEALVLLVNYCKLYADTTSIIEVFEPLLEILEKIPAEFKLGNLVESRAKVQSFVDGARLRRKPLMLQKRKAIGIKTYLPNFHASYSIDKRYDPDQERAQTSKIKAEVKKEFKGAVRELRRDAAFLGREKIERIKVADGIYKKKMDRIVGTLAEQEGAMRGFEREVKKGKRKSKK